MSDPQPFRPRARLLLQLGDQLIRNESVALLELVKNSYDAGASVVKIKMVQASDKSDGSIIVTDDGCGMDEDIIRNVWLEPGTDYQLQQLNAIEEAEKSEAESDKKKEKHYRKPLGEKGIGRFAAHKLAHHLEIVSKKNSKAEVTFELDWRLFEKVDYLDKIKLPVETSTRPTVFTGGRIGTRLTLTNLRESWNRKEIRDLYRSVVAMCSPFQKPDSFRIDFTTDDPNDLKDLPNHEEILEQALYHFDCTVRGDEIIKFKYTFQPFEAMTRVKEREITYPPEPATNQKKGHSIQESDTVRQFEKSRKLIVIEKDEKTKEKLIKPLSLSDVGIGEVRFHGYAFDREPKTLNLATIEPTILKEYLAQNGGVRIYRDGVRVYDYGEPGNDWLDLQSRRVARPGVKLDSNLLVAAVELERSSSKPLVEKTNREGFVESEAYDTLVQVILQCLDRIENYRFEDKEKIRMNYGVSNRKDRVPLTDRLEEARALINDKISDANDKKALNTALARVEEDYEFITETLVTSAGAGMQLSLAVHEIEKIVNELVAVSSRDGFPIRIRELIGRLSHLVERYSMILRRGKKRTANILDIIRDALFFVEYRFQVHKIETLRAYEKFKDKTELKCLGNLVTTGILNVLDNSIFWMDYAKVQNKQIAIDLKTSADGGLSIIIADNGTGFNLPAEMMIRPFVSKRPKGSGLGLYLLDEIMTIHGGSLSFPAATDFNLPDDFKNGAVVMMTFRMEDRK